MFLSFFFVRVRLGIFFLNRSILVLGIFLLSMSISIIGFPASDYFYYKIFYNEEFDPGSG